MSMRKKCINLNPPDAIAFVDCIEECLASGDQKDAVMIIACLGFSRFQSSLLLLQWPISKRLILEGFYDKQLRRNGW